MSQAAIFDTPILKWPFAVRPSSAPCGMAPMAVPVTLVQPLEAPLAAAPAAPKAAVQAGALVAVAATTIVVSVATATDMSLSLGGTTAVVQGVTRRQMVGDVLLVAMWGALIPVVLWLGHAAGY